MRRRPRPQGFALCALAFALLSVSTAGPTAHATQPELQPPIPAPTLEAGVKVPLAGLVALALGEGVRLEAAAAAPGFTAPLVDVEGRLAAKLYPPMELAVGGLSVRPFWGAGVVLLQAVGEWVPGLALLVGAEAPAPGLELPLTLFLEGGVTLLRGEGLGKPKLELSVGVRYALPFGAR